MNGLVAALWLVKIGRIPSGQVRGLLVDLLTESDWEEINQYRTTTWEFSSLLHRELADESYYMSNIVPAAALAQAQVQILQMELTRLNNNGILRL